MKILVPVKRVIDHMAKIRILPDERGVATDHVKMAMNPFDEIALEQAIVLKEQGQATQVVALSVGEVGCVETLRHALALGADAAIHINTSEILEPLDIAKLICQITLREGFGVVILGKQAIDHDCNQVGQMVASLLQWPQGTFISHVSVEAGGLMIKREVDGGIEHMRLSLPAVLTADLRLNQPRYASLPSIMKARSKPIETLTLAQMEYGPRLKQKTLRVSGPALRSGGIQVTSVQELVQCLKQAEVI